MPLRTLVILALLSFAVRAQSASEARRGPLEQLVPEFSATGTFDSIVRQLAKKLLPAPFGPHVLFGFLKAEGPDPQLAIATGETTSGDLLTRLCSKDKRYTFAPQGSIVVVVPKDTKARGVQLLRLRLQRFDMVVDDWPENLLMRLPEFSPEVAAFLAQVYARESRPGPPRGSPGAIMTTDRQPPHTEIHLRDVTVMEALGAISERSITLSLARDPEGRTVFWPMGWRCELPPVGEAPFEAWSRRIFSAFP